MAGRIREEDIAAVREKARIDDVVSAYVTLRNAGGGSQKGLCPFHDEKSPSFHVTPARSFFHCFGCGEGGDVFTFLMKIDGLTFTEAVERLADKTGIMLRREEDGFRDDRPKGPPRRRLIEAHIAAQEWYAEQLGSPDAVVARRFLDERGFDRAAALKFGIGFAPRGGRDLHDHLRGRGFSKEELTVGGLIGPSGYDKFRGRLLWPIRETSGETIGFGARRLFDDDRIEAKYLNTAETPIYKKSQVLYGIDLARREMARTSQAVVVEGYTDVMACHLSGVGTAVATCGTAFGDDHARVVRRFIDDHDESRGEVIFTFDGDAAGQKAALKAFQGDQRFVAQTYISVAPDGQDPCELRINAGEDAVRQLIADRRPLYRFALESEVNRYDLDRADGRIDALRAGARLVASVRDRAKVEAFARELASLVGVDPDQAHAEVRRAASRPRTAPPEQRRTTPAEAPERPEAPPMPDLRDPRFAVERETLKVVLQHPIAIGRTTAQVTPADFTHPVYRAVWELVAAAGGPAAGNGDPGWGARIRDAAGDPVVAGAVSALAVEPLPTSREIDAAYVGEHVFRLLELTAQRRIADVSSRLRRTDPASPEATSLFAELASLEQGRRTLRDRIVGAP
ncbi:MAG: DNA primase [Nocardioidaceae bacterium]|nr:DNA primase [Nocardioidaceae bacterium]MCL2611924.1 DNA primase [Nocardioidaceae bacterium]